jgi:hypothetical protein
LSSVISRYESIKKTGFNSEDETKLNNVVEALNQIGITATDSQGQLLDFGTVMDTLGAKFNTLSKNEKSYITTVLFGTYQRNRGLTLLNNYAKSLENYEAALNSTNAAEQKFAIYQEGVQARLDSLTASWEALWQKSIDSNAIKFFINVGIALLDFTKNFGLLNTTITVATTALLLFNKAFLTFYSTNIANQFVAAGNAVMTFATKLGIATGAAQTLGTATAMIAPIAIVTGIILLINNLDKLTFSMARYNEQVQESASKAKENRMANR